MKKYLNFIGLGVDLLEHFFTPSAALRTKPPSSASAGRIFPTTSRCRWSHFL